MHNSHTRPPRHPGLALIAIFKLFKAIALLLLAGAVLHLLSPGALDGLVHHLQELPLAAGWRPMLHLIDWVSGLQPHNIETVAVFACAYAALYATEGIGLWLQKRWAEFLTIIATASLIPFEIWELSRGTSALKLGALVVNVAIVAYLYYVLRFDRRHGA